MAKTRVAAVSMTALAAGMFLSVSPALAQEAPAAQPSGGLEEIVVTAQRTQTNLQSTPIAVTAISGEALQQKGAVSLLDVQNSTPNLTVSSRSNTGSARGGFTIRGIGVDATASSSAVGLYVDEVYYPSGAGNLLGLFDVDRIEVLRGPQGTLFGRNTIAGAVQYITTKPSQELGGFITGTYGNLDRVEAAGAVNLPISETLAIRASGRYNRQGGYVYDILNDVDRGRETTKQGRLALRWQPDPSLTVDLKGEILNLKSNGRALAVLGFNQSLNPPLPGEPNPGAALVFAAIGSGLNPLDVFTVTPSGRDYRFQGFNAPEWQDYDYRATQANIAWNLSDTVTLKSISAYSFSRDNNAVDIDNTILPIIAGNRGLTKTKLFTQELQLSGTALEDRLHFTVGGYYFNSRETIENQFATFGTSPLVLPITLGDIRTKVVAKAAYGQLTYDLTEQLSLTAGLRYSDEKVTGSFLNTLIPDPAGPLVLPPNFDPNKSSFDDWSPSVGVNFQATPDLLIYAKASKGFRAGGVAINGNIVNPPLPATPITSTPGYQAYDPETAWTYELGTRMQFLDRRVRINPTVFYTDWKDIQFNSFVFTGTPPTPNVITRNAGDARIWGVELEWQAAVSDRFQLNGSFSYLNGKYKRIAPGIAATVNSELQHAPDLKFSVGGRYTVPLENGDKITASVDYAWTADQRSAVSDVDFITQPEYSLLNARLEYALENPSITLAVYGTNLTDEYYYIGGVNGSGTFGSIEGDLGRPREYGVSVRFNF